MPDVPQSAEESAGQCLMQSAEQCVVQNDVQSAVQTTGQGREQSTASTRECAIATVLTRVLKRDYRILNACASTVLPLGVYGLRCAVERELRVAGVSPRHGVSTDECPTLAAQLPIEARRYHTPPHHRTPHAPSSRCVSCARRCNRLSVAEKHFVSSHLFSFHLFLFLSLLFFILSLLVFFHLVSLSSSSFPLSASSFGFFLSCTSPHPISILLVRLLSLPPPSPPHRHSLHFCSPPFSLLPASPHTAQQIPSPLVPHRTALHCTA